MRVALGLWLASYSGRRYKRLTKPTQYAQFCLIKLLDMSDIRANDIYEPFYIEYTIVNQAYHPPGKPQDGRCPKSNKSGYTATCASIGIPLSLGTWAIYDLTTTCSQSQVP